MAQFVDINSLSLVKPNGEETIQISATTRTKLKDIANLFNSSDFATKEDLTDITSNINSLTSKVNNHTSDINTLKQNIVDIKASEWYGTKQQYDAIENKDPDVTYYIYS